MARCTRVAAKGTNVTECAQNLARAPTLRLLNQIKRLSVELRAIEPTLGRLDVAGDGCGGHDLKARCPDAPLVDARPRSWVRDGKKVLRNNRRGPASRSLPGYAVRFPSSAV